MRSYLRAAEEALGGVPGAPRGYQVLSTAGRGEPRSQLALAQHLGVDRTVMTYLLDDLEGAGLVERRPDPSDRRAPPHPAHREGHRPAVRAGTPAARCRGPAARPARPRGARCVARA